MGVAGISENPVTGGAALPAGAGAAGARPCGLRAQRLKLLLPAALLGVLTACADIDSGEEILRDDEARQAAAARENFRKLLDDYRTTYVSRGAHAKSHACLRGYFQVREDLPGDYRHGVFASPGKRYKSWVRLSNGHYDMATSQDYENDARGMAVKLMEVGGAPLERSDIDTATQDFLMANTPVFFAANMPDYNFIVAHPENLREFFLPGWNPFNWRLREMFAGKRVLSPPPASLLHPVYYSITPYKLGPHNIKFAARPCAPPAVAAAPANESAAADFLRRRLRRELEQGEACFVFQVQRQQPHKSGMSLDDAVREWSERDAPFVPLAAIVIPRQDFTAPEQDEFCENLAFAPWHALPEHRPLGQLNRLRRHAYPASSRYRHEQNQAAIPGALAHWCAAPGFDC